MASERQILANRQNAKKATGPCSAAGKKRASLNAYRHGLTSRHLSLEFNREVETLARKMAGQTNDEIALEHARVAAEAELELGRVRRARLALIERVSGLGDFKVPRRFKNAMAEVRWLIAMYKWGGRGERPRWPALEYPRREMPTTEPERTSEAIICALPELLKMDRYENRAANRRDRAVRKLSVRCSADPF